jgi:thiazolylpeptide-type bacteriocin precursor
MADMRLSSLVQELKALEFETFEIQDYTEVSEELMGSTSCSCSSTTSTCSSTTSTTSCCA